MSKYFLLWLEGPLQSWGTDSIFGVRDTLPFPSKSGVLGIVLASMGKGGEQRELLSKLSRGAMDVYEIKKNSNYIALSDYATVGTGYCDEILWQNSMRLRKRDGKCPGTGGAKLQLKKYLQDAVFAALLKVDDSLSSEVEKALIEPCWAVYLGRKCCTPSYPIFQGVFEDEESAIKKMDEICNSRDFQKGRFIVEGNRPDEGDVICLNDVPVSFGVNKEYTSRFITIIEP